MDCKQEPAARTFCRITLLAIEGLLMALLRLAVGIMLIPIHCVMMAVEESMRLHGWRWVCVPFSVVKGMAKSIVFPFVDVRHTLGDTIEICKAEWKMRWRYAKPKMPDGTPIEIE